MAQIIPWDLVEKKYAEAFTGKQTGNPSIDSRMAFGALIIWKELNLSDEETVTMIRENLHCQYFLGLSEFTDVAPFDSSKMVAFRRRFPAEAMAEINEAIIRNKRRQDPPDEPPADNSEENQARGLSAPFPIRTQLATFTALRSGINNAVCPTAQPLFGCTPRIFVSFAIWPCFRSSHFQYMDLRLA
jgi:hypothetical protein